MKEEDGDGVPLPMEQKECDAATNNGDDCNRDTVAEEGGLFSLFKDDDDVDGEEAATVDDNEPNTETTTNGPSQPSTPPPPPLPIITQPSIPSDWTGKTPKNCIN